jgi:hypothetical protein
MAKINFIVNSNFKNQFQFQKSISIAIIIAIDSTKINGSRKNIYGYFPENNSIL